MLRIFSYNGTSIKLEIVKITFGILAIASILMITIASTSFAHRHHSVDKYKKWEELYINAGKLTAQAFRTDDLEERNRLLENAILLYRHALEIYPNEVNTMNNLAANLYFLGHTDEALAIYSIIIKKYPNIYSAYMNRARIYEDRREYEKALKDYEAFMRIVSNMPHETRPKSIETVIRALDRIKKILELDNYDNINRNDSRKAASPSPDVWVEGEWLGEIKAHNEVINGIQYNNVPGWACGPLIGADDVENIVYFNLPGTVYNRTGYIKDEWLGIWVQSNWYHNYCWATGWTCWLGKNYYMLVEERAVCTGYDAPPWNHKIRGWMY